MRFKQYKAILCRDKNYLKDLEEKIKELKNSYEIEKGKHELRLLQNCLEAERLKTDVVREFEIKYNYTHGLLMNLLSSSMSKKDTEKLENNISI